EDTWREAAWEIRKSPVFSFFGKYMNDEGTAPSLAAGAVPFLVLRAVRRHAPTAGGPFGTDGSRYFSRY
ncbi:MAG: hypothetical protein U0O18_05545, partial [Clostridia bacterium]